MRTIWLTGLLGLVGCAQVLGDSYSFDGPEGKAGAATGGSAGGAGAAGSTAGAAGSGKGGTAQGGAGATGGGAAAGSAGTSGGGSSGKAGNGGGAAAGSAGTSGGGSSGKAGSGGAVAGSSGSGGAVGGAGGSGGAVAGSGGSGGTCGDGARQGSEQCDGADLASNTCATATGKAATGTLSCTSGCQFDTSKCEYCGDGKRNNTEACEGADVNGATCASAVGTGSTGSVSCKSDCSLDTSGCSAPPGCGDGTRGGTEECDGQDFGADSCGSLFPGGTGTLTCKSNCTRSTSDCVYCGDGDREGSEACDKSDFGTSTCASVTGKPASGSLSCDASCNVSTAACQYCGNGKLDGAEACDGSDLGSNTCASVKGPLWSGQVTCTSACGVDSSACTCASMCNGTCVDLQTSKDHCGTCGHACAIGSCVAGACAPVVGSGLGGIAAVAVEGANVYAANTGGSSTAVYVWPLDLSANGVSSGSVNLGGGATLGLLADSLRRYVWSTNSLKATTSQAYAGGVGTRTAALGGGYIFWTESANDKVRGSMTGAVGVFDVAGCESDAYGLAATSKYVFFTAAGPSVSRVQAGDTVVEELYSGEEADLMAVSGTSLVWAKHGASTSTITSGLIAGGPKLVIFTTTKPVTGLVADADGVYWTQENLVGFVKYDGSGYRAIATGTPPVTAIGAALATSATTVFYTVQGSLRGVSK
ncbi:MAG: hypothetical protein IT374_07950 [Polyangiaceae bacterium]|nr:hypothetical protein [Polyangiaceae bacterium]